MAAPTITWSHNNFYRVDDAGAAWGELSLGTTLPTLWGAWAEPADQYNFYSAHYSCTPTVMYGHSSDNVSMIGSYLEYNSTTGEWALMLGFTCPGDMVRAHMWTAV